MRFFSLIFLLSDLVDDDLLTVPTKTMVNTSKFKDFYRLSGHIDLVMTITYGI
jgi:hypothetical protein